MTVTTTFSCYNVVQCPCPPSSTPPLSTRRRAFNARFGQCFSGKRDHDVRLIPHPFIVLNCRLLNAELGRFGGYGDASVRGWNSVRSRHQDEYKQHVMCTITVPRTTSLTDSNKEVVITSPLNPPPPRPPQGCRGCHEQHTKYSIYGGTRSPRIGHNNTRRLYVILPRRDSFMCGASSHGWSDAGNLTRSVHTV